MSALIGPLSGALVAGGIYYGFSNLIQTRTEQHIRDLHALSTRLVDSPNVVLAPPSAAMRVKPHPFTNELKYRWNREIAALFLGFQNLDRSVVRWGRSLLYGPEPEGTVGGAIAGGQGTTEAVKETVKETVKEVTGSS
ncbi:hypothetical protein CPC08DRAFT_710903 [Agrocybe pediades]|nr:hypothetical protein CPC08DRAFT_710903 [Agrocybe pediades]